MDTPAKASRVSALMVAAALVGVAIGFLWGNLGRETRLPGDALRTDDATGPFNVPAAPAQADAVAAKITGGRLGLLTQAVQHYTLLNAGAPPPTLETLVEADLLGRELLRDGWDRPFQYAVDPKTGAYAVRSLGPDGKPSDDDLPPAD